MNGRLLSTPPLRPELLAESHSPIQAVVVPGNANVVEAASSLRTAGFDVRAIRPPTVPPGTERLRIILHANNSRREVLEFAAHIRRHAPAWVGSNGGGASEPTRSRL